MNSLVPRPSSPIDIVGVVVARTLFQRAKGMLGSSSSNDRANEYVLIGCGAIHTFGMKGRIDVAFLSASGVVLRVIRGLSPRCVRFGGVGARHTVERHSASNCWLNIGDYYPVSELGEKEKDNETVSRMFSKCV